MGLLLLYVFAFSAGTVFRRQNLTSIDVKFWRLTTVPALKGFIYVKYSRAPICLYASLENKGLRWTMQ